MNSTLRKRPETLLQIIDNYGCITFPQASVICGGDDKAKADLSHLILIHCIHERNGFYVPVREPKVDREMIGCLWVAIEKLRNEDGSIDSDALKTSFTNMPVQICLIKKDTFYNIVAITETNIASKMSYLKDKFQKNYSSPEKAVGQEYIFVVSDLDVVKQIAEFAPNMPNRIAYIEGDVMQIPKVRYLAPKKM